MTRLARPEPRLARLELEPPHPRVASARRLGLLRLDLGLVGVQALEQERTSASLVPAFFRNVPKEPVLAPAMAQLAARVGEMRLDRAALAAAHARVHLQWKGARLSE